MIRLLSAVSFAILLSAATAHRAVSQALPHASAAATDFAVFSKEDIRLETYSTVQGGVYAGRNILVDSGHGIQQPRRHEGDYFAGGNIEARGGLHDFNGNLWANESVQFESDFRVDVYGDITYGTSFSGGGDIRGVVRRVSNTVPEIVLPPATSFIAGTKDVTIDQDATLAPGEYGDLVVSGLYSNLHLSAGDYYFRSFTKAVSSYIYLDLTDGPIHIYVADDLVMEGYLHMIVNDEPISEFTPIAIQRLASDVLFEVHGDALVDTGIISDFFGTLFTPFGDAAVRSRDVYGSVIAGGSVNMQGFLVGYPSNALAIPEPASEVPATAIVVLLFGLVRNRVASDGDANRHTSPAAVRHAVG